MSVCPACGTDVRPIWPTCRSCGTLLIAPPAPVVPIGATTTAAPSTDEQFFAPAVLRPTVLRPTARLTPPDDAVAYTHDTRIAGSGSGAGNWLAVAGVILFVGAAVATAWFSFGPSSHAHEAPVVLSPRAPTAGLPTSLSAIVRIEAESARHTALQAVEQIGTADIASLATRQPSYKWLAGVQPSTDPHTISVAQSEDVETIAVAASNHDVCAFGRWSTGTTAQYVTMAHEPTCAAVDAPSAGWSSDAGGAASDLPDDNG
jgi:hypothetical protein